MKTISNEYPETFKAFNENIKQLIDEQRLARQVMIDITERLIKLEVTITNVLDSIKGIKDYTNAEISQVKQTQKEVIDSHLVRIEKLEKEQYQYVKKSDWRPIVMIVVGAIVAIVVDFALKGGFVK